ncbi:YaaC family protein [Georgenia sp. SUBG003]|uniref:YaaC family protein n=1 Tax=Georgenia sp. SUBG003 TaxID=1497974 RepID=UPI003AB2BB55
MALEQAQQQFAAAERIGYESRPLNLFYGLSQAGRAIAAGSRLLGRGTNHQWQANGHGLKYDIGVPDGVLATPIKQDGGTRDLFSRVSIAIDSPLDFNALDARGVLDVGGETLISPGGDQRSEPLFNLGPPHVNDRFHAYLRHVPSDLLITVDRRRYRFGTSSAETRSQMSVVRLTIEGPAQRWDGRQWKTVSPSDPKNWIVRPRPRARHGCLRKSWAAFSGSAPRKRRRRRSPYKREEPRSRASSSRQGHPRRVPIRGPDGRATTAERVPP